MYKYKYNYKITIWPFVQIIYQFTLSYTIVSKNILNIINKLNQIVHKLNQILIYLNYNS